MKKETTLLELVADGERYRLEACDVHGNGRSNKSWSGSVRGVDVDLPNLRAVSNFAADKGLRVIKL